MLSEVSKTLIKIFAKGFFKANSGFMVCLFGILLSYCFFINTVGDVNLITSEQLTFYHFIFFMTFISSPLMTILVSFIWLIYSVKSWMYVRKSIKNNRQQFLTYSITAQDKTIQLKTWFAVQFFIFIPLWVYWALSLTFGLIFGHYLLPAAVFFYIILLNLLSAGIYVQTVNSLEDGSSHSLLIRLSSNIRKPYWSVFVYYLFDRLKLGYLFVKCLSLIFILFLLSSFTEISGNIRIAEIFALYVATSHSYLLYRHHIFEEEYLSFIRNFPFSRIRRFGELTLVCALLILPEASWLFMTFPLQTAFSSFCLAVFTLILFRCLAYIQSIELRRYFKIVSFISFISFMIILFNGGRIMAPFLLGTSLLGFYWSYYRFSGHGK